MSLVGFAAAGQPMSSRILPPYKFCDIGINLLDDMFRGIYGGKQRHPDDLLMVLDRAKSMGVHKSIITAGCTSEANLALDLVKVLPQEYNLYTTVGVHPTRSNEFVDNIDGVISALSKTLDVGIASGKVVAIGECGLDYDRLHFCKKEQQKIGFQSQLDLAERYGLPMFLHDRNTSGDFLAMVTEERSKIRGGGVIHSYTGSMEDMHALVDLGFYIGINGCSLKTVENLQVAAEIPIEKLLLETDGPWCSIKNSHASSNKVLTQFPSKKKEKFEHGYLVKDRNEPCAIIQVLEVLASIKNIDPIILADQIYKNTDDLFFPTSRS